MATAVTTRCIAPTAAHSNRWTADSRAIHGRSTPRSPTRSGTSGGTNAADEIHVDFVTEPGVLADHHLITRLTNNNGNFSFAAQVRLDFGATETTKAT